MENQIDFAGLKTSWTKFDIVQVMEVVDSLDTLQKFKNKQAIIDGPILRSFLGIKSLEDPIPNYWVELQNYPDEKPLFAFLAVLFTHGEIVNEFATKYAMGNMKGIFKMQPGKQYTNIRSTLIVSGAAKPIYRRTEEVPYDLTPVFRIGALGVLFKEVLTERILRLSKKNILDSDFYNICLTNNFHIALSLTEKEFESWLEGNSLNISYTNEFIEEVEIKNFFSIDEIFLDFNGSKEIYFLGENGDGKSLILMAIYLAFNGNFILGNTDLEQTGKAVDIIRNNRNLLGIDAKSQEYGFNKENYIKNLFAYGTHRGRISSDNPEEYGFMTLFDSEKTLTNPVAWLKDQKLLEFEKRLDDISMFPEKENLPYSYSVKLLEQILFDLLEKSVEIKIEGEGVSFIEKGHKLTFDQLSEGYKSILIFVTDLLYRLSKNAKHSQAIRELKGVVLVDEIDLHLHPKWQELIIPKLRKIFPLIQFVFTTHSPTMIKGASNDAIIFRVYRNAEDGKTRVSEPYLRKDLNQLMINTLITSPLFGLDDSRLDSNNDNSDTSETYLLYRINIKLEETLAAQKKAGKMFVSDSEIDNIIQQIIDEELGKK
jgi:hypothetical protein